MLTLRLLGGIALSDDTGADADDLLRKPKSAALLAYLALPHPGTWHRRDSVVAIFWPDNDQSRGRSALRSALLVLRRGLPDGAIASRGDDELSLDPTIVTTDVAALGEAVAAGRFAEALDLYKGELMPGLFVPDAPEFERWLDQERDRIRVLARKAATHLSVQCESEGNLERAIDAARRASELNPNDEATVRRLIALLDRSGDRAQAFAVYERFRNHLAESLGVRPSAETVALMDAVRTRRDLLGAPVPPASASTPNVDANPGTEPPSAPATSPSKRRRRWPWLPVAVAATLVATITLWSKQEAATSEPTAKDRGRTLIILPMDNETGDSALAYVASGLADGAARRLEGLGGLQIRSGARRDWPTKTRQDIESITRAFREHAFLSDVLLRTALGMHGDSLQVTATVLDAATHEQRSIGSIRFSVGNIRDAESRLASRIAGEVFSIPNPTFPARADSAVDPESYALVLRAWHLWFEANRVPGRVGPQRTLAVKWLEKAKEIDATNARAWSGLSTVYGNRSATGVIPFDEGSQQSMKAAQRAIELDSMQGSAWANLAIMRALRERALNKGLQELKRAERIEPSNPEIFLIKATLLRSARRYEEAIHADRMARALDPLNPNLRMDEGDTWLCMNRPREALELTKATLAISATDIPALDVRIRALVLLGRYDEAIESWKVVAQAVGDTNVIRALASAKGKDGYWHARHADGERRLSANLASKRDWWHPWQRVNAAFATGRLDAAERAVDQAMAEGTPALFRLECSADVDEFRDNPRFAAILRKIGSIETSARH